MTLPVKNILDSILQTEADWRLQLFAAWPIIIGSLKTHIRLDKIQEDMVIVGVYESHWMQELFLLSRVLISSINKHLKQPQIKHIRFKLIEQQKVSIKNKIPISRKAKNSIPEFAKNELDALNVIHDCQLRNALKEYYVRCLENNGC